MRCVKAAKAEFSASKPCSTASPVPARPKSISRPSPRTILRKAQQTLILMPEIALTGQFLDRFELSASACARHGMAFGADPAHACSATGRRLLAGEAYVVVGARSALFSALLGNLGLIVVDEEHDQAYKQDDGAHYHARDMAVVRAHIAKIPVVLSSATPSVETEVNARRGRYTAPCAALTLRRPAHAAYRGDRPAPRGAASAERFIAPRACGSRSILAIERKEQALLFLNRRGYAPLTLCRACGHRFACTICDAWLVDHRFRQRLVCHHCGFSMPLPQRPARNARRRIRWPQSAPASSVCRKRSRNCFPTRAPWCCRAT